jgi:hypothetical protein
VSAAQPWEANSGVGFGPLTHTEKAPISPLRLVQQPSGRFILEVIVWDHERSAGHVMPGKWLCGIFWYHVGRTTLLKSRHLLRLL